MKGRRERQRDEGKEGEMKGRRERQRDEGKEGEERKRYFIACWLSL